MVKRSSGNVYKFIRQNQKLCANCVLWKRFSENFWEILRKLFLTEHLLKAHNYAEYELCF